MFLRKKTVKIDLPPAFEEKRKALYEYMLRTGGLTRPRIKNKAKHNV